MKAGKILERLEKRPLPSEEWPSVAPSLNCLKVQIHNLRLAGHRIASVPGVSRGSRRPVIYTLAAADLAPLLAMEG